MPESLLDRRLKLGTYLGIGLYVHWSFALVVLYVGAMAAGGGAVMVAFAIAQLLGVFFCVTLHEYGHAMAARAFGIGTADITLLPIGGVARLKRMPRIPWQELIVAVAGPAVNVVIAIGVVGTFLLFAEASVLRAMAGYLGEMLAGVPMDDAMAAIINETFAGPSLAGFGVLMLVVNVMLVVFNMIPAFPMDGGRVFRSVMAMVMDYRRATTIAARVGLLCAVLMAIAALSADPPQVIPVLIAAFIGFAGMAEARQVNVMESVRGLTAGQVMIRSDQQIAMETTLPQLPRHWHSTALPALPVVSILGTVVGMLSLRQVAQAIAAGRDGATTAGHLIDPESAVATIEQHEPLESALMRVGKNQRQLPVVDSGGRLVGVLDFDTMLSRGELFRHAQGVAVAAADDAIYGTSPSPAEHLGRSPLTAGHRHFDARS